MKLSLLIMDDNSYEREALRACINWRLLGIESIYLAENGKRGWELFCAHQPHIILSDIKMPEMDGMEFVQKVRAASSKAKVIFLSAYDDFRYAQFALSQNAYRYLLKPVNAKELIDAVRSAVEDVITEELGAEEQAQFFSVLADMREAGKEKYVKRYLLEPMSAEARGELYLQMNRLCGLSLAPQMAVVVAHLREAQEYQALQSCLRALSGALSPAVAFPHGTQTLVLLLHQLRQDQANFSIFIQNALKSCPQHAHLALGVSSLTDNALELPELYQQAEASARQCQRHGYGQCFFHWDKAAPESHPTGAMEQTLQSIESNLRAGTAPGKELMHIERTLGAECDLALLKGTLIRFASKLVNDPQVRWVCDGDAELLSEEALYTALIRGDSVPALLETLGAWLNDIAERFAFQSMDKKQQIALEIKRIIDSEYASNITLKYLSGKVYMSSNYTHILFKSIFGYTVNHYLTQVRIEKARELLAQTAYPIAQIAPLVGYEHSTYFFSIFKRITGATPAEYRRLHQREGLE